MRKLLWSFALIVILAMAVACGRITVSPGEDVVSPASHQGRSYNLTCSGDVTVQSPYTTEPFDPGGANFTIWTDAPGTYVIRCAGTVVDTFVR